MSSQTSLVAIADTPAVEPGGPRVRERLATEVPYGVAAEGVETKEQLTLLRAAGCGLAQGYLFSKPVPKSDLDFDGAPQANRQAAAT